MSDRQPTGAPPPPAIVAAPTSPPAPWNSLAGLRRRKTTVIAALAITKDDELWLRALVARPDGSEVIHGEIRGRKDEALRLGVEVGRELKARTPADFFRH